MKVFTNGCFDIIHRGHLELFKYCKELSGDAYVIVGLNSDSSVRKLKGAERPINSENNRQFMLKCLRFVDEVHIFHEETPYNLIKKIKPDIIVKGGDYKKHEVIGHDLCEVKIYEYIDGYSTTKAIQRSNIG